MSDIRSGKNITQKTVSFNSVLLVAMWYYLIVGGSYEQEGETMKETDYWSLRVERNGDREFVPWQEETTEENALQHFQSWKNAENVTKVWLSVNGQLEKVYDTKFN